MEDRKKAEILARLSNLETEYQMRILLAVEYGSRAYGCASDESDYDIRLIYVYPMDGIWAYQCRGQHFGH